MGTLSLLWTYPGNVRPDKGSRGILEIEGVRILKAFGHTKTTAVPCGWVSWHL